MKEIYRQAHKSLAKVNQASIVIVIIIQVFILGIPYLRDYIKSIDTTGRMLSSLIFAHIVLGAISIYITYKIRELIKVTKLDQIEQEYEDLKIKTEEQQTVISKLTKYPFAVQWSLTILDELIRDHSKKIDSSEGLERLLVPLIMDRSYILGYKGDDLYNIAVYEYNNESGLLEIIYRKCDDRIITHGRKWKPPFGHVGYAYSTNSLLFTSNFPEETIVPTDSRCDTDCDYYSSFIAAPIRGNNNEGQPLGVLAITSSRPNQFRKEDKELNSLIVIYSMILSNFFHFLKEEMQ